jgi:transposase
MKTISSSLFQLSVQCIRSFTLDNEYTVVIQCRRDKPRKPIDLRTKQSDTINRYLRRRVPDLPISGHPYAIDIELT